MMVNCADTTQRFKQPFIRLVTATLFSRARTQCPSSALSVQFQSSFRATPQLTRPQSPFKPHKSILTAPEQFQSSFRAVSEQFQSSWGSSFTPIVPITIMPIKKWIHRGEVSNNSSQVDISSINPEINRGDPQIQSSSRVQCKPETSFRAPRPGNQPTKRLINLSKLAFIPLLLLLLLLLL